MLADSIKVTTYFDCECCLPCNKGEVGVRSPIFNSGREKHQDCEETNFIASPKMRGLCPSVWQFYHNFVVCSTFFTSPQSYSLNFVKIELICCAKFVEIANISLDNENFTIPFLVRSHYSVISCSLLHQFFIFTKHIKIVLFYYFSWRARIYIYMGSADRTTSQVIQGMKKLL